jgi:hypothetical protein
MPSKISEYFNRVANNQDSKILPKVNAAVIFGYLLTPFLEGVPHINKIINQTPRLGLISKAFEKIIKSIQRKDSLRIAAAVKDIFNSLTKPIEELYLNRNIVVAATNTAESIEETLQLKDGTYENLMDGPKQALKMFQKVFNNLKNLQKENLNIEYLRKNGIFAVGTVLAGGVSYIGTLTKNNPLAILGRFFQNYLSDFDKFISNNADRNYSGFGFLLESFFDPVIRITKNKIPKSMTKILLAAQYAINWASVSLANRSQAAEHNDQLTKIYNKPLDYIKNASLRLVEALNPYAILEKANIIHA